MKSGLYFSLLYRPGTGRELAAERSELSAVVINGVYGILVLAAISPQMLQMFTPSLVAILTIFFGPLIGFIVSSLYTRVEMTVGRRLGGTASHDELYRIYAWSFVPAGLAVILYTITVSMLVNTFIVPGLLVSIPAFVLFICGIRNYCSNIIAVQQFTWIRGCVSMLLSCVLFLVLVAGGLGFITFIFRCGAGESLMSIMTLQ